MSSFATTLLVGLGGFLGANARYWLGTWIQTRATVAFPWNTFLINLTGSFFIGLFMGLYLREGWNPNWRLFVVVGVLGGYTTFSSFSYEALNLVSEKSYSMAAGYIGGSVLLGLMCTWLGIVLARAMAGG